jgi:hypothetical protein
MRQKILFILTIFGLGAIAFGQTPTMSNLKTECFSNNNYKNNSVSSFKDELTLKLDVTKISIDKTSEKITFSHSEKIKSESSLILINDTIAFKISIGRVVEYKVKKYLYKADLFRKYEGCWRAASPTNYWYEFYPGVVSAGLGFGYEATNGYLGFTGSLIIE